MVTIRKKVVDVLKLREAYLFFWGKGGGSLEEFNLLPKSLDAGDDVLYDVCRMSIVSFRSGDVDSGVPIRGKIACEALSKYTDVGIGGAV